MDARWLDKLVVHGLHLFQELVSHPFGGPASLGDIAAKATVEAHGFRGIEKNSSVELAPDFLGMKDQNAIDQNNAHESFLRASCGSRNRTGATLFLRLSSVRQGILPEAENPGFPDGQS
jgi:hypothetical protein